MHKNEVIIQECCNPLFFNIVTIKMRIPNFFDTFFSENIDRNLYC